MWAPQGDPLGPLVASLWLSAGVRFVRRHVGDDLGRMSFCMDDRTFSSHHAAGLLVVYETGPFGK